MELLLQQAAAPWASGLPGLRQAFPVRNRLQLSLWHYCSSQGAFAPFCLEFWLFISKKQGLETGPTALLSSVGFVLAGEIQIWRERRGSMGTAIQMQSERLLAFLGVAGRIANTPKFLLSQNGRNIDCCRSPLSDRRCQLSSRDGAAADQPWFRVRSLLKPSKQPPAQATGGGRQKRGQIYSMKLME